MGLVSLTIDDVVLIDHLVIPFDDGLSALTGETGAGKSILLGALGLALGARADSALVRNGSDKAKVLAEFSLPSDHLVFEYAAQHDLDLDARDPLLLRRSLSADGRSRCFINDQAVSVKMLQAIGAMVVEIHGQFDTHGLMNVAGHIDVLDRYAGIGQGVKDAWIAVRSAQSVYDDLLAMIEKARIDEEYLRDSIADLDALAPESGEEDLLQQKRDMLMNREQVLQALQQADHLLSSDDNPLYKASGVIDRIADKIEGVHGDALLGALDRAASEMEEARSLLQGAASDLMDEPLDLESVDDRLYALRAQARKHGCVVDDLQSVRDDLAVRLDALEDGEDKMIVARKELERAQGQYREKAQILHEKRVMAARQLDERIGRELEPLKLGKAKFITQVDLLPEGDWGANGMDRVQFMVATNAGQDAGPLSKIASGGELARFMLAIKSALADRGAAEVMIFDEVDAGVGGATAAAVAERLQNLSLKSQVLVVTHAPQIAAKARTHYLVQKSEHDGRVITDIVKLDFEERADEVARMLSGAEVTEEARAAAIKLMEVAA